jgi:phosphoglycolate phosphatase-like HAD superfamily hydrolase
MVLRAMRDFGVAPEQTFLIGDSEEDMQAGSDAGCRTVRVDQTGFEEAADRILGHLVA